MKKSLPLLFAVIASPCALAQTEVLFVGNSFTHGHENPVMSYNRAAITDANGSGHGGVPGVFKKLTDQAGLSYAVTIEAVGGQTLSGHLTGKAAIIGDPKWDVVVLQENSTRPLPSANGGNPDAFLGGGDGLQDLILAANPAARVMLYETWSSPTSATNNGYSGSLQAMQDDLRDAYYRLHYRSVRDSGKPDFAEVVRVGDAFMRAVDGGYADPSAADGIAPGMFYLWAGDNRHAGKYGSYLSAVMFFAKITGLDPREIATGAGSAAADLGIDPAHAAQIHLVAYETAALADPPAPPPSPSPAPVVNKLVAGTTPYNWNNSVNWSAGALATDHSLLIDAASPANSIVANSTQGSPTTSVRNVSFETGAVSKAVQANATVSSTRILNLSGGVDALGGVSLFHVGANTTGTIGVGTNSGLGKLVIAPAADGAIIVGNAAATLLFGATAEWSGAVTLTKTGPGRLVLAGANTFGAGAGDRLDIAEGAVFADTPVSGVASATGAADVVVREGAVLAGSGQITPGAGHGVLVEEGGVLAPGDGVGALTINGANTAANVLTFAAGACLRMELGGSGGGAFPADKIALANAAAGDVLFAGATIDFIDLNDGRLAAGDYVLFSAATGDAFAGLSTDGEGRILSGLSVGSGLAAYDVALHLAGGSILARISPKPYTAWRNLHFTPAEQADPAIGGDLAAPAGDRIPNLLKYAMGAEPRASGLPRAPGLDVVEAEGTRRLVFTFARAVAAVDVDCVVEASGNLSDWYSGKDYALELGATDDPGGKTRSVSVMLIDEEHRFARLRVTRR